MSDSGHGLPEAKRNMVIKARMKLPKSVGASLPKRETPRMESAIKNTKIALLDWLEIKGKKHWCHFNVISLVHGPSKRILSAPLSLCSIFSKNEKLTDSKNDEENYESIHRRHNRRCDCSNHNLKHLDPPEQANDAKSPTRKARMSFTSQ